MHAISIVPPDFSKTSDNIRKFASVKCRLESVVVRPLSVVFDFLFVLFRIAWWSSAGKELSSWLSDCAVLRYAVLIFSSHEPKAHKMSL